MAQGPRVVEAIADDARVAELEFMAFLQRKGPTVEISANAAEAHGLHPRAFTDLLQALFGDGCLTADEAFPSVTFGPGVAPVDPRTYAWRASERTVVKLWNGMFPLFVRLTHEGRLRMARLRDELDRHRQQDQTGILTDGRYIERDLRIRMAVLGDGVSLSVMMADLDHFKQVNDKIGHSAGDEALRRYFSTLRDLTSAGGGDAYRKGGDETFAILSSRSAAEALQVAEALRAGVKTELEYLIEKGMSDPVTVSVGVLTSALRKQPGTLIEHVDRLLYRAKESRDRVVAETDS